MEISAPLEIRLAADKRVLEVRWGDGMVAYGAEMLRVHSPSAEVKGHFGRGGVIPDGKSAVRIVGVEPVGAYAVKLIFDDGHQSGLFTWGYLRELAAEMRKETAAL